MPGYRKKQPIRNLTRLFRTLGVEFPQDVPKLEKSENIELNTHSQQELRHMPGMSIEDVNRQPMDAAGLSSYLTKIAQNSNDWAEQSESIRLLTPEIDASADIMVSSIISPTDMQTDTVNVICDHSDLGEDIELKVGEELTRFFNDTVELGDKTFAYTKEALYGSGSVCILVLPPKNIEILNNAVDVDYIKAGVMKPVRTKRRKLTADNTTLEATPSTETFSSYESLLPADTSDKLPALEMLIEEELGAALEARNPFIGLDMDNSTILTKSRTIRKKTLDLFKADNNFVIMSNDINSLRNNQDRLNKIAGKMAKDAEQHFLFNDSSNPTYMVSTQNDSSDKQNPAIIQLPSRAVVPVIVPGAPDKHIGYFILVDQWGNPLVNNTDTGRIPFGPQKLTESAAQAMYGAPNVTRMGGNMTDDQRYDITSTIFGITLKQLMQNKLEEYGMVGATIEEHDAISACLFRNLILKKRCAMVFVPEPLMIYYRFEHRQDGTGKSITESMSTMLSLRTVLLMSYIMAATENSVNNKTISVAVDEKQSNIQQYLDMVRNAYVQKKMMRFDVNPLTVQRDLIQKSLTILPKGIKGISDSLDVQTEHRSTGAIAPDNDLMEKLTNWIITWLQVPHSALNHLSENEYSRSVATTNLFFSNNVKNKQKIVIKHMTKFIKLYTRYSSHVRGLITTVLKSTSETRKTNESTEAKTTIKSNMEIKTNDDNISNNVDKIIGCLKINLPTPRIVADKAQYKEIEEYLGTIEKLCGTLYNDDMLPEEAKEKLGGLMTTVRASVMASMTRDYVDNIGFQSTYDLPQPTDINLDNILEIVKLLSNQQKRFSGWMSQVAAKEPEEEETEGTSTQDDTFGNYGDDNDSTSGDNNDENTETTNDDSNDSEKEEENPFDNFEEPPTF